MMSIVFIFHSYSRTAAIDCSIVHLLLSHLLTKAARDTQRFAGDPRGIGRSEKDCGWSDVFGLANAAQGCLCFNAFAKIALIEAGCTHSLRYHHTRVDGVD